MADDFDTLLQEALADPAHADYRALRQAYANSRGYLPWGREQGHVAELHRLLQDEDWEAALELVESVLEEDPLSISIRFAYAHILEESGDDIEAGLQRTFANGLLRAILRSGDGKSPPTAFQVLDNREMYLVIEMLGLQAIRSQLSQVGSEWVDLVECKGPDGRQALYFNVSLPQDWLVQAQETEPAAGEE